MSATFTDRLAFGKLGESQIARWLNRRGWNVLPVYEKQIDEGKGPQLFTPNGQLIAPDLFAFSLFKKRALWIEAKHKTVFTWHRITARWVTGIDLRHYGDYIKVSELSPYPVWVLFLHTSDRAGTAKQSGEPWPCPTGLFGNTLDKLRQCENHRSDKWGKSGMVYWARESLQLVAPLCEIG